MNCKIHIHLLNELFSQELADEKHGGKESADNLRYDWEDELDITSAVTLVQEQTDAVYTLAGYDENDALFSYEIPAMHLFEIHSETDPITYVGASKSIVDHCTYNSDSNGHTIRIFLKDYEPMANPVPGIFIASKAFPKALIR
jgi:cytolysin (calcineurin-like family phosphatase)